MLPALVRAPAPVRPFAERNQGAQLRIEPRVPVLVATAPNQTMVGERLLRGGGDAAAAAAAAATVAAAVMGTCRRCCVVPSLRGRLLRIENTTEVALFAQRSTLVAMMTSELIAVWFGCSMVAVVRLILMRIVGVVGLFTFVYARNEIGGVLIGGGFVVCCLCCGLLAFVVQSLGDLVLDQIVDEHVRFEMEDLLAAGE